MRLIFIFCCLLVFLSCSNKINPSGRQEYNDSVYQQFWTADWSADDQFIATAGVDSIVRIYYADNLKLYKSIPIQNTIHSVKWNPQTNLLAIATLSAYVQLLDIETGKLTTLTYQSGHNEIIGGNGSRAIGWNYTGDMLAVGDLDGKIKIWDKQGNLLKEIKNKYSSETSFTAYLSLDWHPFKNQFLVTNFEIQLHDSAGIELKVMEHVNNAAIMLCTKWHPSGNYFVIGDYGHNWEGENVPSLLHFWDYDGQLITSLSGSKGEYRNIDWNTDGSLLATASDVLRIWSKEGKLLHKSKPDGSNYLWGLSWNKKGTRIITSSRHKTIALWDSKGKLLKRINVK